MRERGRTPASITVDRGGDKAENVSSHSLYVRAGTYTAAGRADALRRSLGALFKAASGQNTRTDAVHGDGDPDTL